MCLKYQNKNKQPSHCKTLIGYVGTSWTHNLSITLLLNTTVLPRKKLTSTRISRDSSYAQRNNKRNTLYFSIPFFMLLCTFIAQAVKELLMKHNSLSAEGIIRVHSCYVVVIINMHYIIQKISSANIVNLSPFNSSLCVFVCVCTHTQTSLYIYIYIYIKSTFDVMN